MEETTRILSNQTPKYFNKEINMSGWVHSRRDHGKLIFIDLRDSKGLTQLVFLPNHKDAHIIARDLRPEYVISIKGKVNKRPVKMINEKIPSGSIELEVTEIEILNKSKTPPFEIDKDTIKVEEELRLKYRYLDLRSERLRNNINLRHKIVKFFRDYLCEKDFVEVETPSLTKSTPEGAREYIVPSRLYPGNFYVLPQSPQQFKQLLMVGSIERYFQLARCFRDEDQRGDRQPEFTQLDIEMSFINQEDIFNLIEPMIIEMIKKVAPDLTITTIPFPRITYKESMEKYKCDKPDLRKDKNNKKEMAFCWIVDFPLFKYSKTDKKLVSAHHPFTMPHKEDIEKLTKDPGSITAYCYDLVLNGFEIASGSIRIHKKEIQDKIFSILGISEEEKKRRFGHMLEAFEYGAPPHGGIAPGIDRLAAILAGENVIREVIAFPKTGDARDPLMDAPASVSKQQLKDVHITLSKEAQGKELQTIDTKIDD